LRAALLEEPLTILKNRHRDPEREWLFAERRAPGIWRFEQSPKAGRLPSDNYRTRRS
jgi:ABC-type uncharacterized transport system YnjBCD ATPase subunit